MTRDRGRDDEAGQSWLQDIQQLERDAPASSASQAHRPDTARRSPDGSPAAAGHSVSPQQATQSTSPLLEAIQRAGSFEELHLAGTPTDSRYGRSVDARVVADGRTHELELRLFRRGEDDLTPALLDQLDRWATVGSLDGIVPVLDGTSDPRPWCCTPRRTGTVADRSPEPLSTALRQARALSETVAALHERGVLHAGLDPGHVVFPADSSRPHLDSVGLFDVYRRHDGSESALDPCYAPPEYFDDRYGVVDRTTDIYGLGTVFYRLFTGEAPYGGSLGTVREDVLTGPVPRPSAVADVPQAVDDLVERAMATDKFDRYESVTALHEDVAELCRWFAE